MGKTNKLPYCLGFSCNLGSAVNRGARKYGAQITLDIREFSYYNCDLQIIIYTNCF